MKIDEDISEAEFMYDASEELYCEDNEEFSFKDTRKKTRLVDGKIFYMCSRCGQYKSKDEYYKDKRVPCGIRNKCKLCYHKK